MPHDRSAANPADNTFGRSAEKGHVRATRTPTPRTALRLREDEQAPPGSVAVNGIRRDDHGAFREFVDSHHHVMRDYLDRRLRGTHDVSAEDVLQEALIRIWRQFNEWPAEPERRIIFLRQTLKVAAIDAIRVRRGRNGTTPREYPIDFADLERAQRSDAIGDHMVREIGQIIARDALERMGDGPERIQRSVLLASCAALTDLERRVLFMTARGDNGVQIADELGVTHQHAREALMRARKLVRSLIEHADAGKLRPEEAKRLWQLRDAKLSGRPKREAQRHLDHCTTCQRIIGIEDGINAAGMRVFLPLPAIALAGSLFGTGAGGGVAATGGAGSGAAGTGATSVGTQVGGTLAATSGGATAAGGSVLAGITAKVALGLAGLAVAGSTTGVGKLIHDRQEPEPRQHAALTASAVPVMHDATAAARSITTAAPAKPKHRTAPARQRTRTRRPAGRSSQPPQSTTATAQPVARTVTSTFASTRTNTSTRSVNATPKPNARQPSSGEFVLGSG